MIIRLNHVTIRTAYPERMKKFYSEILSMEKDRRRPDHFAGFHLRSMTSSGEPLIHVMTGEDAQINDGTIPIERGGAVHHSAFYCQGFEKIRAQLSKFKIDWREYRIPEFGLWQIFVFDPHGILLELTFESAVEGIVEPPIPKDKLLDPKDRSWFNQESYAIFG